MSFDMCPLLGLKVKNVSRELSILDEGLRYRVRDLDGYCKRQK